METHIYDSVIQQMQDAEKSKKKGAEKKELVMTSMRLILGPALFRRYENDIEYFIDLFIRISKGEFNINKKKYNFLCYK